jgi:hypothetical protein
VQEKGLGCSHPAFLEARLRRRASLGYCGQSRSRLTDRLSAFWRQSAAIVDTRIKGQEIKLAGITDDQSLYEALLKVAKYARGMSFEQQAVPVTRLMIAESVRFPKLIQTITRHMKERFRYNIVSAFESLGARGDIPDRDHEESAGFFIDLIVGTAPQRVIMDPESEIPTEKELEAKVQLFILGRFGPEIAQTSQAPLTAGGTARTSMSAAPPRVSITRPKKKRIGKKQSK